MSDAWKGLTPPYATIVADPPWPYDTANAVDVAITRSVKRDGTAARGVSDLGFTVMTMADLAAMPVKALAADNAHLYLWTTNAFMVEAHDLAKAWGFIPKTILTWTKVHQNDPTRVSMKTGYWFRGATEHAVFAVRGSLRLSTAEGIPSGFIWPRIGRHSVKPLAFYDVVEKASPGPYVELFARTPRLGWDHWGYGYETAISAAPPTPDGTP
jgi:N6-adenosine-specific RNA methylase IME4